MVTGPIAENPYLVPSTFPVLLGFLFPGHSFGVNLLPLDKSLSLSGPLSPMEHHMLSMGQVCHASLDLLPAILLPLWAQSHLP